MYYVLTEQNAQLSIDASYKNFSLEQYDNRVLFEKKYVDIKAFLADRDEILRLDDFVIGVSKTATQKTDVNTIRKAFPKNTKILAITDGMNHFDNGELLASGATEILPLPNFTSN